MQGPTLAAISVALWLGLTPPDAVAGNDAVARARALLAKNDPKAAVAILEPALPTAGADLGPMIVVLRQAYTRAAEAAAKAGKPDEADEYRENLLILNRKMRGQDAPLRSVAPEPAKVEPPKVEPLKVEPEPSPMPEPPAPIPLKADPPAEPQPAPRPDPEVKPVEVEQPRAEAPAAPSAGDVLAKADADYLAERYIDAGKGYATLARSAQLPEERKLHWAYCRSVEVVRRIKARPATAADWASIDREIAEIKALSPKYWYAEYLRNRAADQSRAVSRQASARVVRGAMPESDAAVPSSPNSIRDLTRSSPPAAPMPPVGRLPRPGAIAMAIPDTNTPPAVSTQGESSNWQVKETTNFVIYHADPALADEVAKVAETTRESILKRWTGSPPPKAWTPRCEVYLYPTTAIFVQVTGQPAESPGFSTMEASGGRVTGRRVKLRADHPTLVSAVLPHEVTHVLLADLFPVQQVPRWADEGIAVLSEPAHEQEKRLADLDTPLNGGRIFSIENLMVRDFPEGQYWALYYAQSVSLTRFLVEQGSPGQFIEFLQATQRSNRIEDELRRVYKIDGYADLQKRWLAYAHASKAARVASARAETTVR